MGTARGTRRGTKSRRLVLAASMVPLGGMYSTAFLGRGADTSQGGKLSWNSVVLAKRPGLTLARVGLQGWGGVPGSPRKSPRWVVRPCRGWLLGL